MQKVWGEYRLKPILKEKYKKEITSQLIKKFQYKNIHQVPKLKKITVHVGAGEFSREPKKLEYVMQDLSIITGQKPIPTKAKKAISAFRIKKGMVVGCKVTLRGDRMYYFFEKFVNFAAPRIRDFRGFSSDSFDGRGSYNLGVDEQLIFPEIERDKVKEIFGMDITIHTTANTDDEAKALLSFLGMPFRKE